MPTVKKIGIIGAGVMGSQIAAMAVNKGFVVLVRDISDDAIQAGFKFVRSLFDDMVKKNRISAQSRDSKLKVIGRDKLPVSLIELYFKEIGV